MLTVPEAARRVGRTPSTERRWIRSGRSPSERVGARYLIDEAALGAMNDASLPLPRSVRKTWTGRDMPDTVALIKELRAWP